MRIVIRQPASRNTAVLLENTNKVHRISVEAEHPLLLRLRVIRIDLAGTAGHMEQFIAGQQIEEGLMFLE
jgi:hypothetical protein